MRKVLHDKSKIKEGDTKEVLKFAFFPKIILNHKKERIFVWLERYIAVYRATVTLVAKPDAIGMYGVWLAHHNEREVQWKKTQECLYDKNL